MSCSHSKTSTQHHHEQHDDHSMMQMFFHGGVIETILFDHWKTTSLPVFISSWILVFILGMLYEGIKELRQSIEEKQPNRPSKTEEELETLNTETTKTQIDRSSKKSSSYVQRLLFAVLYTVQMMISYFLMLIAMTFNIYLFVAIILGVGVGHLFYTMARLSSRSNDNQP